MRSLMLILTLLAALPIPLGAAAKPRLIERIVAVVNDEPILMSDLNRLAAAFLPELQRIVDPGARKEREKLLRRTLLDKMIADLLIDQQARSLNLRISKREVDLAIRDVRTRHRLTAAAFAAALRQQGYTTGTYREMVRRELRKLKVVQFRVKAKIRISRKDIRAEYNRMISGVVRGKRELRVKYILVPVPAKASAAKVAAARSVARGLLRKVVSRPTRFAGVAKVAVREGKAKLEDLGFVSPASLTNAALVAAIQKLKVGQIGRKLVRTPLGFHILQLFDARYSGVRSFREAAPGIGARLRRKAMGRYYKQYVLQLRAKASVIVRL